MKRILLLFSLALSVFILRAQPAGPAFLSQGANAYMHCLNPGLTLDRYEALTDRSSATVGHLFLFQPAGFLIVAASEKISPVYAYSTTSGLDLPPAERSLYMQIITGDLAQRIEGATRVPAPVAPRIRDQWEAFLAGDRPSGPFQQWPAPGTTYTEGWLETNWTQTYPYNMMCPMDLNAGSRSVAGCPATAMAQIVNYHRTLNQTRFSDNDDYFHSYGSGNQYYIDDDWQPRGFPSFDSLNQWLDTLEAVYAINDQPGDEMMAALTFACGVGARQVFTASVSGTFGLDQALMSFQRFGYDETHLVFPDDTTLRSQIAENVKVALPAQLGLLVSTGSGGHNVVVDGYNTDEFYHFNFGWGGQANGWYTLPPESAPYNLTIIESVIVDIKSDVYTKVPQTSTTASNLLVRPNPFNEQLVITGARPGSVFHLYDTRGNCILKKQIQESSGSLNTGSLSSGLYFYSFEGDHGYMVSGKLIKN